MNPEKATDYLSRVNWKSLVEWLTAEAILNRPSNPLQFCRDLIGEKLADQSSSDYRPDLINDWLRNCYTEATALVDEHGIIQGKTLETAQQSLPEQITELRRKVDGMQKLLDASSTIATLVSIVLKFLEIRCLYMKTCNVYVVCLTDNLDGYRIPCKRLTTL